MLKLGSKFGAGGAALGFIPRTLISYLRTGGKLSVIFLTVVLGCGVQPAEEPSTSSTSAKAKQQFLGYFYSSSNSAPEAGLHISLVAAGMDAHTDQTGWASITLSNAMSGDAELQAEMPDGAVFFRIENIPDNASVVSFQASVDHERQLVTVTSSEFTKRSGSGSPSEWVAPARCFTCHADKGFPLCGDPAWEELHSLVFDCAVEFPQDEPAEDEDTSVTPGDDSQPGEDPTAEKDPNKPTKPAPKKPNDKCTTCHADRGGPRCGNSSWESIHRSVYQCKDDNKKDKDKDKKKDKDKDKKKDKDKDKKKKGKLAGQVEIEALELVELLNDL